MGHHHQILALCIAFALAIQASNALGGLHKARTQESTVSNVTDPNARGPQCIGAPINDRYWRGYTDLNVQKCEYLLNAWGKMSIYQQQKQRPFYSKKYYPWAPPADACPLPVGGESCKSLHHLETKRR